MPNPMDKWKHGRSAPRLETKVRILPLKTAPKEVIVEQGLRWRALLSKRVAQATDSIPDLKGFLFRSGDCVYVAERQEIISDPVIVRQLDYEHRGEDGRRVYFYLYMDEVDPYLALVKGIRK